MNRCRELFIKALQISFAFICFSSFALGQSSHYDVNISVVGVENSSADQFFASISGDGSLVSMQTSTAVTLWDGASGRLIRPVKDGGVTAVGQAGFSQDGRLMVTFLADQKIGVWSTDTGHLLRSYPTEPFDVFSTALAMSPNGQFFARIDNDGARVFDTASGHEMVRQGAPGGFLPEHVRWDEKRLVSYSSAAAIVIGGAKFDAALAVSVADLGVGTDAVFAGVEGDGLLVAQILKDGGNAYLKAGSYDLSSRKYTQTETLEFSQRDPVLESSYQNIDRVLGGSYFIGDTFFYRKRSVLAPTTVKINAYLTRFVQSTDARTVVWARFPERVSAIPIFVKRDASNALYYSEAVEPAELSPFRAFGTDGLVQNTETYLYGIVKSAPSRQVIDPETGEVQAECRGVGAEGGYFLEAAGATYFIIPPTGGQDAAGSMHCSTRDGAGSVELMRVAEQYAQPVIGVGVVESGQSDRRLRVPVVRRSIIEAVGHDLVGSPYGDRFSLRPNNNPAILRIPGQPSVELKGGSPFTRTIAGVSGDGRLLLDYGSGGFLAVRDRASGEIVRELGRCSVNAVQTDLKRLDLLGGTPDGSFGPKTAAAIAKLETLTLTVGQEPFDHSILQTDEENLRMACAILGLNATNGQDITGAALSPDGRYAAIIAFVFGDVANNTLVRVWDVASNTVVYEDLFARPDFSGPIVFSPDGQQLIYATGATVDVVDWRSRQRVAQFGVFGTAAEHITATASKITILGLDGSVQVFDSKTGHNRTIYAMDLGGNWSVLTKDGFYAANNDKKNLIQASYGRNVLTLDQLAAVLYRPDLVAAFADGDPHGLYKDAVAKTNLRAVLASGLAPTLHIDSIEEVPDNAAARRIRVTVTARDGGIGKVVVQRGDSPIAVLDGPKSVEPGRSVTLQGIIPAITGKNQISVVAFNESGIIESDPLGSSFDAVVPEQAPTLYVLSVGINDYLGNLHLNYATPDARALTDVLQIAAGPLFSGVEVRRVLDKNATQDGIAAAFNELASKIKTGDVFILFLSGHGATSDGHFYYIPVDFVYEDDSSFAESGIGDDQIQRWMASIKAQKSVLLIDACESGTMTNLDFGTRGLAEAVAIDKLNKSVGRSVITASSAVESAMEGYKGHGIFTYSLIEALANADYNQDKLIDLTELFQYVDERVPEISVAVFGQQQTPQTRIQGSNFPLAHQTVSKELDENGPFVPKRATHVVIATVSVFRDAKLTQSSGETLQAGAQVAVVGDAENGVAQIARDGDVVGYVAAENLLMLQ